MYLGETLVEESFAEAFGMRYTRVLITAHDPYWLAAGMHEFTGFGASIIACDVEAGCERHLSATETPDGRPGASVLLFSYSTEALAKAVPRRAGQCLMTCATTAVFDGLPEGPERIPLGSYLRYFGDGFQQSKLIAGRRYWRIPVMDGEFLAEESLGVAKGVAGGALILEGRDLESTLSAVRRAGEALAEMPGVITPFPGGAARSGSKVGSRYRELRASTNEAYCPSLRGRVDSRLHPEATCACEIVIDGVDDAHVSHAMAHATRAAAGAGLIKISAANYGGHLGKYHLHLHQALRDTPEG